MNQLLKFLLVAAFLALQGQQIFAQTDTVATRPLGGQAITDYFSAAFEIAAPDSTFLPMTHGYGWEEPATGSVIVCIPTPGSYEEMVETPVEKEGGNEKGAFKIISKEIKELNGRAGVLVHGEITEDQANPFCMLMYATPLGENSVLMVNAVYPKSQHERLYPKMLTSFGTARLKQ